MQQVVWCRQGFTVSGRIRTATEEIDISILNDSATPAFAGNQPCCGGMQNWTGKCAKMSSLSFARRLNRNRRSSSDFLVSWNGFASTVTKEMLRGSREETSLCR